MKKHRSAIFITLVFVVGVCLLLYPTVSEYINSLHQSQAISTYAGAVNELDETQYDEIIAAAEEYNAELAGHAASFSMTEEETQRYQQCLNVDGSGMMGYVEIPSIDVSLPIYHGTSDEVLQSYIGHLEWTSLPVGGTGTHCVLSGHRGLPSAKLFTNLDEVAIGDVFYLNILNEVLTYEVDQILIVEPDELDALQIVDGQDYCTLFTCTPYGINTHRLLVRGHRVENQINTPKVSVSADAMQLEPMMVAPIVAIPLLLLLLIWVLFPVGGSHRRR